MMFRVRWVQTASDELTTVWMEADSATRQIITAGAHAVDRELQMTPEEKGESRNGNERIFFAYPLGVLYAVDAIASTVWVTHVWNIRRKT